VVGASVFGLVVWRGVVLVFCCYRSGFVLFVVLLIGVDGGWRGGGCVVLGCGGCLW
jgi:hypothetical protein